MTPRYQNVEKTTHQAQKDGLCVLVTSIHINKQKQTGPIFSLPSSRACPSVQLTSKLVTTRLRFHVNEALRQRKGLHYLIAISFPGPDLLF